MKPSLLAIWVLAACTRTTEAPAPAASPSFDTRTPLPLTAQMAAHQKEQMRDHLRVVQEIAAALATDDFDAVATAAQRIAWSGSQSTMCKHLGAGAPGFAEMGEHFHRQATTIVDSARRRDHTGVISALDATVKTCVGCHDRFQQQIRP